MSDLHADRISSKPSAVVFLFAHTLCLGLTLVLPPRERESLGLKAVWWRPTTEGCP